MSELTISERYPKAICHLHYAMMQKRLGLIFGSGISEDLWLPNWKKLLELLETELNYPNNDGVPQSYRAEQLFQYFKAKREKELGWSDKTNLDAAIGVDWCKFVSARLYARYALADEKFDLPRYDEEIKSHPYLMRLASLATNSQALVVTHNFDDAFERALDADPAAAGKETNRRYNTFWRPQPFLRSSVVNIYHPNGYKPFGEGSKGSENIILTEGNFADHLANTNTVESHFLLRHLADRTCLIVGHSLSDGTLKNALRLHANQRPGHINYYIHWDKIGEAALSPERRHAIREANFATYNLVTIFANSKEIGELISLIGLNDSDLKWELTKAKREHRYVYYISGAVSAGKSTVLGHLRDLATVEEWPDRMPTEMNKPSTELKASEGTKIDDKLAPAIWKKNEEIGTTSIGIIAVDRAPLDFLAFPTRPNETISDTARERSKTVLEKFIESDFRGMNSGHVILLQTDEEAMFQRQIQKGRVRLSTEKDNRDYIKYLDAQQKRMIEIYAKPKGTGTTIKTDACSIVNSVKDVARTIHFEEYETFPFAIRLENLTREGAEDAKTA